MFRRRDSPFFRPQVRQSLDAAANRKMSALEDLQLAENLQENVSVLERTLGQSDDLVIRRFRIGAGGQDRAVLVYVDGLCDAKIADDFILKSAMFDIRFGDLPEASDIPARWTDMMRRLDLPINEVEETDRFTETVRSVLSGDSALLVDGVAKAWLLNTKGWDKRGVEEPRTEAVVRGPRSGFTDTLRTNTAQLRLRLKDPDLRIKQLTLGERSNTDVAVAYIEGVADSGIVQEVFRRLREIRIDGCLDSGYIEQFIEDSSWTPFPLIQNTERPDKAAAALLEGRVVILCDNTPFVLIAPTVFSQFYQSPEDYYERFLISTLIRIIRIISMAMALLLPSLYIAFSSFHPEMIPSRLVIAMAAGRSTVPFPSIVEAFLMEVTMEILREASVRLPGPIGPTIGIVGALVIGEAAVQAGIVSPIMVIVVALTTIGSFASPSYSAAIALRVLRFPMMMAAAMFGLYGIMLFLILIVIHLCSLKSFGVPYMSPFAPSNFTAMKDTVLRFPLYWMKKRPEMLHPRDAVRMEGKRREVTGHERKRDS